MKDTKFYRHFLKHTGKTVFYGRKAASEFKDIVGLDAISLDGLVKVSFDLAFEKRGK